MGLECAGIGGVWIFLVLVVWIDFCGGDFWIFYFLGTDNFILVCGDFFVWGEDLLSRVGEYALGIGDFLVELEISLRV